MRLFLAVEVGEEVREELGKLGGDLRNRWPHLRVVPPKNLHITLRFFGDVGEEVLNVIKGRLHGRHLGEGFTLRLGRVGGFPSRFGARVVWVGLEDDSRLAALSDRIDSLLGDDPVPPRDKPFVAHITVARSRRPVNVERFSVKPVAFRVSRVVLYRSILAKPNAIYEPLEYFYLGDT